MIHVDDFDPVRNTEQRRWLERRLGMEEGDLDLDLDLAPVGTMPRSTWNMGAPQDPAQRTPMDLPDPIPPAPAPVNPYKVPGGPRSPDPVEELPLPLPPAPHEEEDERRPRRRK